MFDPTIEKRSLTLDSDSSSEESYEPSKRQGKHRRSSSGIIWLRGARARVVPLTLLAIVLSGFVAISSVDRLLTSSHAWSHASSHADKLTFVPRLRAQKQQEQSLELVAAAQAYSAPQSWDDICSFGADRPGVKVLDNRQTTWPRPEPANPPTWSPVGKSGRPLMGWLNVITHSAVESYAYTLSHLNCYASRRGIPFIVDNWLIQDDRHFFNARLRNVLKHLEFYDWLLVTDSDLLIVDSQVDIREWILRADDDTDVMLVERVNHELGAFSYLVKNSVGGRRFIERWMRLSDQGAGLNVNFDNGLLVELLAQGVRAPPGQVLPEICYVQDTVDWLSYFDFLECFDRRVRHLRGADPTAQFWDADLYGQLKTRDGDASDDDIVRVRVFKPFSSFIRVADARTDCAKSWSYLFWDQLLPTDFMLTLHGADAFIPIEATTCSAEWRLSDRATAPTELKRLSLADSRAMLVSFGYYNYEGCHLGPDGAFDCQEELARAPKPQLFAGIPLRWQGGLQLPYFGPHP